MNTLRFPLLISLFALLLSAAPLSAQDADEKAIKQRILERLETVDALKLSGAVGENKNGLLEQRAMLKPSQTKLMNEENADRRALYAIVGKRLGITSSVVGQGRAADLRKKSAKGVWLQAENGSWYKKD